MVKNVTREQHADVVQPAAIRARNHGPKFLTRVVATNYAKALAMRSSALARFWFRHNLKVMPSPKPHASAFAMRSNALVRFSIEVAKDKRT
jgi:hypothetical protein